MGQRKGIGIANPVPLYVTGKNVARNQLLVAPRDGLLAQEVRLRDVNVISGDYRPHAFEATVKLSYRQQPVAAVVQLLDNREALVCLENPQVRPGAGPGGGGLQWRCRYWWRHGERIGPAAPRPPPRLPFLCGSRLLGLPQPVRPAWPKSLPNGPAVPTPSPDKPHPTPAPRRTRPQVVLLLQFSSSTPSP